MENKDKIIKAYKKICRLASVPEILIEFPTLILEKELDSGEQDFFIQWAKDSIKDHGKEISKGI